MWSVYSKGFGFVVYTFICAFWKIKFFWLLRPSKSSGPSKKTRLLDSWPLSMPKKTRPWVDLFKNIVLYLLNLKVVSKGKDNFVCRGCQSRKRIQKKIQKAIQKRIHSKEDPKGDFFPRKHFNIDPCISLGYFTRLQLLLLNINGIGWQA